MKRTFTVTKAEREKLKFSAMYMGATGSGKTLGALITAKGLVQGMFPKLDPTSKEFWEKIGVIDTEHNRSKVYADTNINGEYIGSFLHVEFDPPYDVEGFVDAVNFLKKNKCEVIIVDSLTHAWDDSGGILDLHSKEGGQFATWLKINPIIKRLYQTVTADNDVHIIATVRSKIKYEAVANEMGKMKVSKIGLKPVMRDDFEYEVLTALHFDEEHKVSVVKDNTHTFEEGTLLNAEYGKQLYAFLEEGVDVNLVRKERMAELVNTIGEILEKNASDKQLNALMLAIEKQAKEKYGVLTWRDLPTMPLESILQKVKEVTNVAKK